MTPVRRVWSSDSDDRRITMPDASGAVEGALVLRRAGWAIVNGPIVLAMIYLAVTVALYAFGPWPFPVTRPLQFYGFLLMSNLGLLFGYLLGSRHAIQHPRIVENSWSPERIVRVGSVMTLVLLVPTWLLRIGFSGPDFATVIAAPGEAYQRSLEAREGAAPTIEYVRMLAAPFTVAVMPLLVVYWRFLAHGTRALALVALASTATMFVFMGTNKALADALVLVPVGLAIGHLSGTFRLSGRVMIAGVCVLLIGFAAFGAFFAAGQATRQGSASFFGYFKELDITADRAHPLVEPLPQLGQVGVLGISLYTTMGYAALDLSLREPFVPCYGVGNSFFLSRQAARLTGKAYFETCSYPARIEAKYGWNKLVLWSSAYPWFASDLTFPGTVVLMVVIGFAFGLAWIEALRGVNPYAVVVAALFLLMLAYLPGNNQLMQSGESLTGFVGTLAMWRWNLGRRRTVRAGPGGVAAP